MEIRLITSVAQLGSLLAKRRNEMKLSQAYVAEITGISRRTLQQIESGQANPTIDSLLSLLQALGLQLSIDRRLFDEDKTR